MKRVPLLLLAAIAYPWATASANYTLEFEIGAIKNATGAAVPIGSVGVLVADTGNNGFTIDGNGSGSIVGSTLSIGQSLGGADNIIIKTFTAADLGGDLNAGDTGFHELYFQFDSSLGTFQSGVTKLALYWFPTITTTGSLLSAGLSFGFYRSDTYDSNYASNAFFVPPESGKWNIIGFDTTNVGTINPNDLNALYVTAIPEPSSVALVAAGGVLVVGWMLRRRKNS